MSTHSSRLIFVSNRLPIQLSERAGKVFIRASDGGLVSAAKSYFEKIPQHADIKEKIWVGAADFSEERWKRYMVNGKKEMSFTMEPLFIPSKEYSQYYNGFCNAILWPLFHYFPSYAIFTGQTFESYEYVNQLFCNKILSILQPGDIVWIHDYQLMMVAGLLREKSPQTTIGFFLHIPFPSYEIFRLMHKEWKEKIIHGLLGADLIGFHTHDYIQHFLEVVHHITGIAHQFWILPWNGRKVKVGIFPLGIDFEKFHNPRSSLKDIRKKKTLREKFSHEKIIFSVDRLDYTKGITHRLTGYDHFLDNYPEWRRRVLFILVVVPSRQIISQYLERRKLIEEQISRINGKFSTLQWQPILYQFKNLKFSELSVLYQISDVALITPLRDGMNLVAKEFIASRTRQDGVLILSKLAGAAHEMGEAILVNPTDQGSMAEAISRAMNMDLAEQKLRMGFLQARLKKYDVVSWFDSFLKEMKKISSMQEEFKAELVTESIANEFKNKFDHASKRLILIDYDGTLVPFDSNPADAKPTAEVISWLKAITRDDKNQVAIISGRKLKTLEQWFQNIPIHLIGEHGIWTRLAGHERKREAASDLSEIELIRATLELYVDWCPGSFLEEKENSMAWHYREVKPQNGFKQSRELIECLFHLLRNSKFDLIDGNKVVEIRPSTINKGTAAIKVEHILAPDFIIVIGDDTTDEDMFEALQQNAITIKVGEGESKAKYKLSDQRSVLKLLQKLTASANG
ncbi:MAG TPA: bifunctional alpha,alpha-trehalose-phosphate synthase (UDP-forming)/trehalose-phosphatase [Saprospiraceae bacterium]|nr:bifunctional alpha,alpha-trehalose-phosphate synthase (UDP-forming)/trehalose-phosphatase [Saprospiraceae bacterium]